MVLVTCRGKHELMGRETENDDVLPCTWHTPLAKEPPLYGIVIRKDFVAAELIRQSGSFVVNFMPFALINKVKEAMGVSAEYVDKVESIGVHEAPCEKLVDQFRLEHALGWLECEVVQSVEVGDHILFAGRVLFSNLDHDDKRPFHVQESEFTTTR